MSIASQITRLQNIKTAIRNALVNKGVSGASTHDMDDFATDIASIPSGGTYQSKKAATGCIVVFNPNCCSESISYDYVDVYYKNTSNTYNYVRRGGSFSSWDNVVVPVTDEVYVYWHSDSSVNNWGYKIDNILPYTGSSFTTPTATNVSLPSYTPTSKNLSNLPESSHPYGNSENYLYQVSLSGLTASLYPDSGYDAMSSVTIPGDVTPVHNYPLLQSKSVTPTSSAQTVKPDGGYVGLSEVSVGASSGGNTQEKETRVINANSYLKWSGNPLEIATITPDSGYDGMSKVKLYLGAFIPRYYSSRALTGYEKVSSGSTVDIYNNSGVAPGDYTIIVAKMRSGGTNPSVSYSSFPYNASTSEMTWTQGSYKYWSRTIASMYKITLTNNDSSAIDVFWITVGIGSAPTVG